MKLPTRILRTGDENKDVGDLQRALVSMGFDLGTSGPSGKGDDNDYGGRTERALRHFQQYRMVRTEDGRASGDDGTYGTITSGHMVDALEEGYQAGQAWLFKGVWVYGWRHHKSGRIPTTEGRSSTFGGPDDKGDRRLSQGRVYAGSAAVLYTRYADLVELGLFRKDANGQPYTDPLPEVYGVDYDGTWGSGRAGISWLLNPDSFYCALPTSSPQPDVRHARAVFWNGDKAVVVVVSDYGPSRSTGRKSDLSPGALYGALEAKTDDWLENQCWAADDHPLGPVGKGSGCHWAPGTDSSDPFVSRR